MPIYEFKCLHCDKKFDVLWRVDSIPGYHRCPDCGGLSPKQLFSYFNFQFSPYLKELREGNMVDY